MNLNESPGFPFFQERLSHSRSQRGNRNYFRHLNDIRNKVNARIVSKRDYPFARNGRWPSTQTEEIIDYKCSLRSSIYDQQKDGKIKMTQEPTHSSNSNNFETLDCIDFFTFSFRSSAHKSSRGNDAFHVQFILSRCKPIEIGSLEM